VIPTVCPNCGEPATISFYRDNGYEIERCVGCRLLYVPDAPEPQALRAMYDKEEWTDREGLVVRVDADYDDKGHDLEAKEKLDRLRVRSGRLLDVGCGSGDFLKEAGARGFDAEGVELSARRVATARARGLHVHHGDLLELDLPAASYDAIICIDILSHVREPLPFLLRVYDLVAPGGVLMLETGNKAELESPRDGQFLRDFWGAPGHLTFFGESQLRDALTRVGFAQIEVVRYPMIDSMLGRVRLVGGKRSVAKTALWYLPPARHGLKRMYRRRLAGRPESASLVAHASKAAA